MLFTNSNSVKLSKYCRLHFKNKILTRNSNQLAILLQKNLAHKNNSLYNPISDHVRCTFFDSQGNISKSSFDMKRDKLIHAYGLFPRDLRKIEKSKKNDLVPTLLVRKNNIVICLLTIRALVKSDMVILFDSMGINLDSRSHRSLIEDLQTRLKNQDEHGVHKDPLPYEFRALESIFISALSNLTAELKVHSVVTNGILKDLEYSITRDKLRFLLVQNKKLSVFYKKSFLVREMIDELLEQDDVLSEMYLSEKMNGKMRDKDDHEEIEMLLETYYNHADEIVQTVTRIISHIRTTEEIINIILDSNRNQLMLLGLNFSIGLLSLGGSLYIASLYGMNLENMIEERNMGFALISTLGVISMSGLFLYSIKHLHRLQKVTLMRSDKTPIIK